MIPKADIVGWRRFAPWISDAQVEQDLIMSRALVAIFQDKLIAKETAFRGGTALHKLYLNPARRYSEDIDLVQITSGPIGPFSDALQGVLNPFLGEPRRKQAEGGFTLTYRVESEGPPCLFQSSVFYLLRRYRFCPTRRVPHRSETSYPTLVIRKSSERRFYLA